MQAHSDPARSPVHPSTGPFPSDRADVATIEGKPEATSAGVAGGVIREEAFGVGCALQGFDLLDFDAWLEALAPCGAKDELTQRRALALEARLSSDAQTFLHHLEWMQLRWRSICREEFLLPLTRKGKAHGESQAARRRDKPATADNDLNRNHRLRAFHARLGAKGERDATKQTADEYGLDPRTIRRIVNNP